MGYAVKLQKGGGTTYCLCWGSNGQWVTLAANDNKLFTVSFQQYGTLWDDDYITVVGYKYNTAGDMWTNNTFKKKCKAYKGPDRNNGFIDYPAGYTLNAVSWGYDLIVYFDS